MKNPIPKKYQDYVILGLLIFFLALVMIYPGSIGSWWADSDSANHYDFGVYSGIESTIDVTFTSTLDGYFTYFKSGWLGSNTLSRTFTITDVSDDSVVLQKTFSSATGYYWISFSKSDYNKRIESGKTYRFVMTGSNMQVREVSNYLDDNSFSWTGKMPTVTSEIAYGFTTLVIDVTKLTTEEACDDVGYYWYDSSCHPDSFTGSSDLTDSQQEIYYDLAGGSTSEEVRTEWAKIIMGILAILFVLYVVFKKK